MLTTSLLRSHRVLTRFLLRPSGFKCVLTTRAYHAHPVYSTLKLRSQHDQADRTTRFPRFQHVLTAYLLAHLSRRLTGELIVYPWSGVRRRPSSVVRRTSSVVRRPQCSNIFFSETARPIKAKFYVEPPWVGGTKFCSRHLGHMTKMAATPIYGKNPSKIFFSRTGRRISTKLGM